ncbi:MAG: hypothetical protein DHS20C13_14270 [Thermodesulfobacteriota bacterium]|nr:MAG: hypothetical protein DHS20C13_14270 [Thermodesulfobacteriota bacterium]
MKKTTVQLKTLADIYDIPLGSLRKLASKREFPGILKRKGTRTIYVDLRKFDEWFRNAELTGENN